jgi:2'-5' RNA ligase
MAPDVESVRMFVAVEVPQELRERAAALAKDLPQDAITPVKPENMHLTLRFIGEVPSKTLSNIEARLREVEFKKFVVPLRGTGVFPNEDYVRVVWAGCESPELKGLAEKVIAALRGIGKEEDRGFSAHLTIARVRKKIDAGDFLGKHSKDEFGSFEVNAFYLMRSELKPGVPPKYTVLAAFEASG